MYQQYTNIKAGEVRKTARDSYRPRVDLLHFGVHLSILVLLTVQALF